MTEVERDIDLESPFDSAIRVRTLAYSQVRVGVSLLAALGNVYVGCSIENVSLGLTICAEPDLVLYSRTLKGRLP
jgi:cytidine deaminase